MNNFKYSSDAGSLRIMINGGGSINLIHGGGDGDHRAYIVDYDDAINDYAFLLKEKRACFFKNQKIKLMSDDCACDYDESGMEIDGDIIYCVEIEGVFYFIFKNY